MMNIEARLLQVLEFNENLAFSLLELVDKAGGRFYPYRYLKTMWALSRLTRKGLVESKRIGLRRYYIKKHSKGNVG